MSSIVSKVFIDTNILIYAMDNRDPHRRAKARTALARLGVDPACVISTQVMQEFYVAATGKLKSDPLTVKQVLQSFQVWEVVVLNSALIFDAIDCSILNRISLWDALIVAAAASARCETLWSEDLSPGQIIRGVRIVNPLE